MLKNKGNILSKMPHLTEYRPKNRR